jgi:hypothetical protein
VPTKTRTPLIGSPFLYYVDLDQKIFRLDSSPRFLNY